ncbi:MAG: hypothetical protein LLG97_03465 [Deltaproteobacteria bacterium]|nr:hypothetical protein [Deltaproteobacteria bacterium]
MSREEKGTLISVGTGGVTGSGSVLAGVALGASKGAVGAAALSSGLSVVGSLVGGGMLAGIGVVCIAPILGGVAFYGIYRLWQKI